MLEGRMNEGQEGLGDKEQEKEGKMRNWKRERRKY